MEYYNSFHTIRELLQQGKGRLLVDCQRLNHARRDAQKKGKKSRLLQLIEWAVQNDVPVEEHFAQELQGLLERSHYRGYILALTSNGELGSTNSFTGAGVAQTGRTRGVSSDIWARISSLQLELRPRLLLLLDGILDMGNLGAIVRSADLFGVGAVFVSHRSAGRGPGFAQSSSLSQSLNHNLSHNLNQLGRVSCGASAWVPVIECNLNQTAKRLEQNGYWLYAANMQGQEAAQTEFQQPCALILGSEERGISTHLKGLCAGQVSIPTEGHIDSLNVSAAAAVLMYEIKRQWKRTQQIGNMKFP